MIPLCTKEGEIWAPLNLPGFEHYLVSKFGRLYNTKIRYLFNKKPDKQGYINCQITDIDGKQSHKSIHILVALTFIPNPENKPTVDHINRVRNDNRVENLRWATYSEQIKNRSEPKNTKCGRPIYQYDLNNNLIKEWNRIIDAAIEYDLNPRRISDACSGTDHIFKEFIWRYKDELDKGPIDEIWKLGPYPEYRPIHVSNYGRVKNYQGLLVKGSEEKGYIRISVRKIIRTGKIDSKGRPIITYKRVFISLSNLVAATFLGRDDIREVNHKDGNTLNNHINNLEYATSKENSIHALKTGLRKNKTGCKKPVIQLDLDGNEINRFNSMTEAAKAMNCHKNNIINVCNNRSLTAAGYKWQFAYD